MISNPSHFSQQPEGHFPSKLLQLECDLVVAKSSLDEHVVEQDGPPRISLMRGVLHIDIRAEVKSRRQLFAVIASKHLLLRLSQNVQVLLDFLQRDLLGENGCKLDFGLICQDEAGLDHGTLCANDFEVR